MFAEGRFLQSMMITATPTSAVRVVVSPSRVAPMIGFYLSYASAASGQMTCISGLCPYSQTDTTFAQTVHEILNSAKLAGRGRVLAWRFMTGRSRVR